MAGCFGLLSRLAPGRGRRFSGGDSEPLRSIAGRDRPSIRDCQARAISRGGEWVQFPPEPLEFVLPKVTVLKPKRSRLVLQFQRQVGAYPRACFLEDGMRVADLTFCGMNPSLKRIVSLLRDAGVTIETDAYSPTKGEK